MNRSINKRAWIFSLLLISGLIMAACAPIQLPTTSPQDTSGEGGVSDGDGEGETNTGEYFGQDDEQGGDTIPQQGPIAGIPATGGESLERFPEAKPANAPQISLGQEEVAAGQEIVVFGTGFVDAGDIEIYAGRPDVSGNSRPLTTVQADEAGDFTAHIVLPNQFPENAVTQGQLLFSAASNGEVLAQWVVLLGGAASGQSGEDGQDSGGSNGDGTSGDSSPGGTGGMTGQGGLDLSQLGFDFNTLVLPLFNQAFGTNFSTTNFRVVGLERAQWSDGCLGLGQANEYCTQQIVPGYRFSVVAGNETYEIRTNETGTAIRFGRGIAQP